MLTSGRDVASSPVFYELLEEGLVCADISWNSFEWEK